MTASCAHADSPRVLHLTFVGDLMAHPVLFATPDYGEIYRGIADVLDASDLVFANLEFPVDSTRPVSGYPLFNGHPDYVRAALEAGINVLSAANNHAFDGGEEGVLQTVRALTSLGGQSPRGLFFSGMRGNPSRPFAPATILVNGARIGFIAVTQFVNQWGGGRYVHVVDYADHGQADEFVGFVKETSAFYDAFIVSYHGDREYVQEPDPAKRAFFHRLVENGATIVFAHHPHVLQQYELERVGGTQRLIMYSMGNFISGMAWRESPPDPDSLSALISDSIMLQVELTVDSAGGTVSRAEPVPIADSWNDKGELVVMRLDELANGKKTGSSPWRTYFESRRERIANLLRGQEAASPPGAITAETQETRQ
ncbi:MAG TPA: CapA family protein [Spirochaetia bacterium]|nr:CapA family protein [Spirochaetia bacterium]